jgi:vacuolar-type H+-ATPase subunit I/STV1
MFLRPSFWLIILATIFLPTPFLFSGEVYRWTDKKGTVHFTDDASKIPEEHSEEAERIEVPEEMLKETERTGNPEGKSDRVKDYLEELDKGIEAKIRTEKRISELEEELRLLRERLKKIEAYEKEDFQYYLPFVDKRTGKLVPMASPYYNEKRRLERKIESINAELRTLRERLLELKRGL